MSSNSYTSSSYFYSSSTNTTNGTSSSGHRYSTTSHTDPEGFTIVRTAHQDLGQAPVIEERRFDRTGQEQPLLEQPGTGRRITELGEDDQTVPSDPRDTGTAYGGPQFGAAEGEGQGVRTFGYDGDTDRVTYDSDPLFGLRSFNQDVGAYDNAVEYDTDGAPRRRDGGPGYAVSSGYSDSDRRMRQYEDPSTGARIRRESDVDSSIL